MNPMWTKETHMAGTTLLEHGIFPFHGRVPSRLSCSTPSLTRHSIPPNPAWNIPLLWAVPGPSHHPSLPPSARKETPWLWQAWELELTSQILPVPNGCSHVGKSKQTPRLDRHVPHVSCGLSDALEDKLWSSVGEDPWRRMGRGGAEQHTPKSAWMKPRQASRGGEGLAPDLPCLERDGDQPLSSGISGAGWYRGNSNFLFLRRSGRTKWQQREGEGWDKKFETAKTVWQVWVVKQKKASLANESKSCGREKKQLWVRTENL